MSFGSIQQPDARAAAADDGKIEVRLTPQDLEDLRVFLITAQARRSDQRGTVSDRALIDRVLQAVIQAKR